MLSAQAFERHKENNVDYAHQTFPEVDTDSDGNAYLDFNGDFVKRNKDNKVV